MTKYLKFISCTLTLLFCFRCAGADVAAYSESDVQTAGGLSLDTGAVSVAHSEDEEEKVLLFEEIPVETFRVENLSPTVDSEMDYTDWWFSEWEDCRFLFLPATADRSQLTILYEADGETLFLNDTPVVSGETTSLLGETDEFRITLGEKDCGTLKVMQSNLGCIYITTPNGGLDYLDSHWWYEETGSVLMMNADGSAEYSGELEKITSHGNSSWDYSKKKPYNFKLPQKENLYGMGKAKKWTLLSNYLDHSMLRNKVTMEMSRAAGMEAVMDSTFVDVYADGSYRGTYQLTERVQIQKNRVNIRDLEEETEKLNEDELKSYPQMVSGASSASQYMENSYKYYDIPNDPEDITGGYLLEFIPAGRYGGKADSGFVTARGQAIKMKGPEYASKAQIEYIRSFVQELEDAIYSDDGCNSLGKHYSEYIDVDSLVTAYLIQEITKNIDGTSASFFLWKDSDENGDGKLHCGPVWDFDLSYNNFITTVSNSDGDTGYSYRADGLYAAYFPISGYDSDLTDDTGTNRPTCGISWIGQLYKRGDIVKRSAEIYFERFVPYLDELTDTTQEDGALFLRMAEEMLPSAEMNNYRWHTYGGREFLVFGYSSGADFMESTDIVRNFLEQRSAWLKEFWAPELPVRGDVNDDGTFDLLDVILLQKYLLGTDTLNCWKMGDLCKDGEIDVFDLAMMKKELFNR